MELFLNDNPELIYSINEMMKKKQEEKLERSLELERMLEEELEDMERPENERLTSRVLLAHNRLSRRLETMLMLAVSGPYESDEEDEELYPLRCETLEYMRLMSVGLDTFLEDLGLSDEVDGSGSELLGAMGELMLADESLCENGRVKIHMTLELKSLNDKLEVLRYRALRWEMEADESGMTARNLGDMAAYLTLTDAALKAFLSSHGLSRQNGED